MFGHFGTDSRAHSRLDWGAPEMHPDFRWFVQEAKQRGIQDLIVRSNLTILRANKTYRELPEFFAEQGVHVVSSLPYYKREKTDRQRGDGVFNQSINALKVLNALGYGKLNTELQLDLVYNPSGAFLPGDQAALEQDFKKLLVKILGLFSIDCLLSPTFPSVVFWNTSWLQRIMKTICTPW